MPKYQVIRYRPSFCYVDAVSPYDAKHKARIKDEFVPYELYGDKYVVEKVKPIKRKGFGYGKRYSV